MLSPAQRSESEDSEKRDRERRLRDKLRRMEAADGSVRRSEARVRRSAGGGRLSLYYFLKRSLPCATRPRRPASAHSEGKMRGHEARGERRKGEGADMASERSARRASCDAGGGAHLSGEREAGHGAKRTSPACIVPRAHARARASGDFQR